MNHLVTWSECFDPQKAAGSVNKLNMHLFRGKACSTIALDRLRGEQMCFRVTLVYRKTMSCVTDSQSEHACSRHAHHGLRMPSQYSLCVFLNPHILGEAAEYAW